MPTPRKPLAPPIKPENPRVLALSEGLLKGIDKFTDEFPMSYIQILHSIEWMRYSITESIIRKNTEG